MNNINVLGEHLSSLEDAITRTEDALASVKLQMGTVTRLFEELEKATEDSTPISLTALEAHQARMKSMQSLSPAALQAEAAVRPQMPEMPAMPTQPTAVPPPNTKTDLTKPSPEGPSDSDFTLAITKMSRSYNGFLGGEVQRTLAWFGIEPPNGVLNVPMERRYEFLDALEANAKEEAAG